LSLLTSLTAVSASTLALVQAFPVNQPLPWSD